MHRYIVIGVSSGIGLALVQELLTRGHFVLGIGRNNVVRHENYEFVRLDLNDAASVKAFEFPEIKEPYILVYNSGVLGEVKSGHVFFLGS